MAFFFQNYRLPKCREIPAGTDFHENTIFDEHFLFCNLSFHCECGMYIMYVDESGDPGVHPKSSPHFILSGPIVSQNDWDKHLTRLKAFRKSIKAKYGLNQREEIHAAELIRVGANSVYKNIRKSERIAPLKDYANEIPSIFDTSYIINICIKVEEHSQTDIFELAWRRLFQRYDTFLKRTGRDKRIIVADDTQSLKLMKIYREMRVYNPTPSHFSDY